MKKVCYLAVAIIMCSCTSREEKIAETIKQDMFKSLYDFDSYQPVETKIDSLKNDCYGDTIIFDNVLFLNYATDEYYKVRKEYEEQEEIAKAHIPTDYTSERSDKIFGDAVDKMGELRINRKNCAFVCDSLIKEIRTQYKKCDGAFYGWFVAHKYRCKTRDGKPAIAKNYYLIDKECKRIIRQFGEDEISLEKYREFAELAQNEDNEEAESAKKSQK